MSENNRGTKKKRVQTCAFCKNHGKEISKTGHQCFYKLKPCNCLLCRLLKQAQTVMCHQQRFWRHQKLKLEKESNMKGVACNHCKILSKESHKKHQKCLDQSCCCEFCNKKQVCDKCRNHDKLLPKKDHNCDRKQCVCEFCSLTDKRRKIMKHLQRVRRSDMFCDSNPEVIEAEDCFRQTQTDLKSMKERSLMTTEQDPEVYEGSDGDDEDEEIEEIEAPKRQQKAHQRKKRVLTAKSVSPYPAAVYIRSSEARRTSPSLENRSLSASPPKTPVELPSLIYCEQADPQFRDLTSPPSLIRMSNVMEDDDEDKNNQINSSSSSLASPFSPQNISYLKSPYRTANYYGEPNEQQLQSSRISAIEQFDLFKTEASLRDFLVRQRQNEIRFPSTRNCPPIRPQPIIGRHPHQPLSNPTLFSHRSVPHAFHRPYLGSTRHDASAISSLLNSAAIRKAPEEIRID